MAGDTKPLQDWLDLFFDAYYQRRPVNATFIGVEGHDDRLPDSSDRAVGETLDEMKQLLRSAARVPRGSLLPHERLDLDLACGFLETQIWEFESDHFHRRNPSLHVGEAVFGVLSLFLNAAGPLDARFENAAARMRAIPEMLRVARQCVRDAPTAWTERAIRECDGAMAFFGDGIRWLVKDAGAVGPSVEHAADVAHRAFQEHREHLRDQSGLAMHDDVACGDEALDLIMRRTHFLEEGADELADRASTELTSARSYLREHASDFGATGPEEALAALNDVHPTTAEYLGRYDALWYEVRDVCQARDLISWPDFPIRYVPRPRWARTAAPHLYFLFYRSPRAFNRPPVHDYLVTPIEADMPADEQRHLLETTNESVIKLNHVIHHGSVGHHVQNWHAFQARSRIGQVAAVDCASRIAMGCGGTMAEGWACYATDLMGEVGMLTPLERYAEVRGRARMCARAIVDIRLHQGRLTLAEAAAFYVENAYMSQAAATSEAVKNSMFPGGALMYLAGRDSIHELRDQMKTRWGSEYSDRRFHDHFLSFGSVPVALVAREMARA